MGSGIGIVIDLMETGEDGVGVRDFFCGRLLATFLGKEPKALSVALMVCTVGNAAS
jgi:hypothetical protein